MGRNPDGIVFYRNTQRDVHGVLPVNHDLVHDRLQDILALLGGQLIQALANFPAHASTVSVSARFLAPLASLAR